MTTLDFIDKLKAKSVTLERAADRLRVEAAAGTLSPDLRAAIVARKAELLAVLGGDWFGAAKALLFRYAGVIDDDEWWSAGDFFMYAINRGVADGLERQHAEQAAYRELANCVEMMLELSSST